MVRFPGGGRARIHEIPAERSFRRDAPLRDALPTPDSRWRIRRCREEGPIVYFVRCPFSWQPRLHLAPQITLSSRTASNEGREAAAPVLRAGLFYGHRAHCLFYGTGTAERRAAREDPLARERDLVRVRLMMMARGLYRLWTPYNRREDNVNYDAEPDEPATTTTTIATTTRTRAGLMLCAGASA